MNAASRKAADMLAQIRQDMPDTAEPVAGSTPVLPAIVAATLAGKPMPPRKWLVEELIPARTVTLLGGDGAAGKTLLALQLACAAALRAPWIGRDVKWGRSLYLSAEDDLDEIHRRLQDIAAGYEATIADLGDLTISPLAGTDAVLGAPDGRSMTIRPTPLWAGLCELVGVLKPRLVVLDTLADIFAGEENSRSQARQFIGLLRGLAIDHDLTVLVLGHPSLTGISSGSGASGSTGWSNSVRSRLYLERVMQPDGKTEADADLRMLSSKKANYSRKGTEIFVRWRHGMFWPDGGAPGALASATSQERAEELFQSLVEQYATEGRPVSATPSANYAPAIFARDPRAAGVTKGQMSNAMNRLLDRGTIRIEEVGPASKRRSRLIPA